MVEPIRKTQPVRAFALAAMVTATLVVGCGGKGQSQRTSGDTGDAGDAGNATRRDRPVAACPGDNGGITLPPGFCATVFADSIGHARHLVVAPNGDVYVNTWSGSFYPDQSPLPGGFIVALRDTSHDGKANVMARFGATGVGGGHGGTGIGLYNGALYAEEAATIVRYTLARDQLTPTSKAEVVVSGLPLTGDHPMHPFAIDSAGAMYVNMGSATNSCQVRNRTRESPGRKPCTELETRGGIWRFDANQTKQVPSLANRYATGIRNADGIAIGPDGSLYAMQHGRDQLAENWPNLYTSIQGQNLPAEELLLVKHGADYGWPYCYFDNEQQKLVLAPEYGGDGKTVGQCAQKTGPIAFFPAHWAPLALQFYTGTQFPEKYRGGAFIAFHGSWNRAPGPQQGYNVVFLPFAGRKPSAKPGGFEIFADGFAQGRMQPDQAAHRPSGLAQGPDGALYISDDKGGRVWRVTYQGTGR